MLTFGQPALTLGQTLWLISPELALLLTSLLILGLDALRPRWEGRWRPPHVALAGLGAALIATIILLYYGDLSGLKGKVRKWYGWIIIIMSDLAFASATIFSMKRLFVPESEQQSLVNTLMLLMDMGLALVLLALGIFMGWRLFDLFKKNGLWSKELAAERKINAETEIEEIKRKLDELQAAQEEVSK